MTVEEFLEKQGVIWLVTHENGEHTVFETEAEAKEAIKEAPEATIEEGVKYRFNFPDMGLIVTKEIIENPLALAQLAMTQLRNLASELMTDAAKRAGPQIQIARPGDMPPIIPGGLKGPAGPGGLRLVKP